MAPDLKKTVPDGFRLGWTMANLYTVATRVGAQPNRPDHLPSQHELDPRERTNLEMIRLKSLVGQLSAPTAYGSNFAPNVTPAFQAWWQDASGVLTTTPSSDVSEARAAALKAVLPDLNVSIFANLAQCGHSIELAYQSGRSLRDSVNPPPQGENPVLATDITWCLGRQRVTTIQEWLTTLAPQFPDKSAKLVATSLGRWADFAAVTLADGPGRLRSSVLPGGQTREVLANEMAELLLRQGDAWLALLVGEKTTQALLSPEGYVAAGEAALRRTVRIIGMVLRRYWAVVAVLVLALAAVLVLTAINLNGASKVWTSIAAIAGTLGVSWKGIGGAIPKLAKDAEQPIFGLEEIEAMAWTVTELPSVTVTRSGVQYLRQAGAAAPGPLGAL